MSNVSNNACALTVLSPIKNGHIGELSYGDIVRNKLIEWDGRGKPNGQSAANIFGAVFHIG